MSATSHPVLEPVHLGDVRLPNRAVVAPMSRVSTAGDGVPTDEMSDYYAEYAAGGFGLIVTEGTYTDDAHSQAYANQPAIVTDAQVRAWARVTDAVHLAGGRIFLQLMHAGALVQGNHHRRGAIAPSAVQPKGVMLGHGYGGGGPYRLPREMTEADFAEVVNGFATAAHRARTAGFDGVEVHGANGYLLDQFLTSYTNTRADQYGGNLENRVRLLTDVLGAIHDTAGEDFHAGVRVSQVKVNDSDYRWSVDDAEAIFKCLAAARPAYVHVSSEDLGWEQNAYLAPGVSITAVARSVTGLPVIANGALDDLDVARRVLVDHHADMVSIGHAALANPDWPRRLASGGVFREFEPGMLRPEVTIANTRRWREERDAAA